MKRSWFSYYERLLAFRYLRSRKQEGFISVVSGFSLVGIALGVATLIVVMAVMNGFRKELFTRILGMDGHLNVVDMVSGLENYNDLAARLRQIPGVVSVSPMIQGQVMVMANDVAIGAAVRGMQGAEIKARDTLAKSVKQGSLDGFDAQEGVMIGARMAQNLGVEVGENITLVSPKTRTTVMGSLPRMKSYPVVGLFDIGMFEYDSGVILMPLPAAQLFFQLPEAVNMLELRLSDPMQAMTLAHRVSEDAPQGSMVYDWQRSHAHFVNALKVERNVMFLILTLIILVAAFNIISSLIMLVKDKAPDIAILRTMGATKGAVMRIFFLCGASIGVMGTLAGTGLGLAFALNIESIRRFLESLTGTELFAAEIYFLSTLPADVDGGEVLRIVVMALVLTFLSTIYPAWRAAKTLPAEALKYGG